MTRPVRISILTISSKETMLIKARLLIKAHPKWFRDAADKAGETKI